MSRYVDVRSGAYHDSVSLMQVSRDAADRPDVTTALVAMATDLNLTMLADLGFETPGTSSPNDLLVAIEAADDDAVAAAVATIDEALSRRPAPDGGTEGTDVPPARTVTAAARRVAATLALVSTPGRYAAIDAADALDCGLDVMVFSDNVSLRDEVRLKQMAADRGLLVMGPDCGTAVVDGVGLGFANVVRPGPVGIVAASGTGAQHLLCLLDGAGIGVRHCLGVGGRDLNAEVAARSTLTALDRLAADETVDVLVVVSKPPAAEVAERVTAHAESLGKPVVLGYLGAGRPDLTATAASVADRLGVAWREPEVWGTSSRRAARKGDLRGLFCGGTLCDEAMLVAEQTLGPVSSNVPLAPESVLPDDLASRGHTFIDFGDDRLTVGRPHPMIDPTMRTERLLRELADPDCAVVLLDVVLGHAAHPDPAADLAPLLADADKPVVVSLVGTRDDPQDLVSTATRLADAGAVVHASNAAAAREAVRLVQGGAT